MPHGKVKEVFPDGQTFDGDYHQGKRHGYGILTMANGHVYSGQFVDNVPGGQGKLEVNDGTYYEGQITFTNNRFKIVGKVVKSDGTAREGTFDGNDAAQ